MEEFTPEKQYCPERDERCEKLARKVLQKFMKGRQRVVLDPVLGGITSHFGRSESQHYDHVEQAVTTAGIAVFRDDPRRLPIDDLDSSQVLRRVKTEK